LTRRLFASLALFVAWSNSALAHEPASGLEGFFIGLQHPLSEPAQILLLLGLGVLAGGYLRRQLGWLTGAFLLTMLGAMVADGVPFEPYEAMYATAVAACVLAALLPGRLLPLALAVLAFGGLWIGTASVPDPGPPGDRAITFFGSFVGAGLSVAYLAVVFAVIRNSYPWVWVPIALRIVAAWIGAISLLMLALMFAPMTMPA